jgi:CHAD domain-containing protein
VAKRNLEREVKLSVDDGFEPPDLTAVADGLVQRPRRTATHVDSYYDTLDFRLVRSGITLRSREEGGKTVWTVKLPMPDADMAGGLTRLEVNVDATAGRVPADASRLVRAHVRTASLRRVARVRTERTTVTVARDDQVLAVIDDDQVSVETGTERGTRFRELEVELSEEAPPKLLIDLVDVLRDAGARKAKAQPKLVQALGPAAAERPELDSVELGSRPTIGRLVQAALTGHVRRIVDHDPVIRLDLDPEGVHQMRVATRRLRADLRTFRPVLDRAWSEPLRDELKWLGRGLGTMRDADVMLGNFRKRVEELPEGDQGPAGKLVERLVAERNDGLASLRRLLDGRRYRLLLDALVEGAIQPRFADDVDPDTDARSVVPGLVAKPWTKLRREVRRLDDDPADEALHKVRIRAKRARYASQAAAPAVGDVATELADRLSDLQDVLGELQDTVVAEQWLRSAATDATVDEALVIGLLIARERAQAYERRAAWEAVWRKAKDKKHTAWITS